MRKAAGPRGPGVTPGPQVPHEWDARRRAEQRIGRFGLTVAVVSVAYGVYASNPLLVRRVHLVGDCSLPPSLVHQHTDALLGQHWLVTRTKPVQRRLEALPSVKRAKLTRWPAGEVAVRIEERRPLAVLTSSPKPLFLDAEGVLFERPDLAATKYPLLTGRKFARATAGSTLAEADLAKIRDCLGAVRRLGLPAPRQLAMDSGGALTLRAAGPLQVRLGRHDLARKLALAKYALDSLQKQGQEVKSLDLRTLEAPTWSPNLS